MLKPITLERVDAAIAKVLDMIENTPEGEEYWPLFDRLEKMRETVTSRKSRVAAARSRIGVEP